MPLKTLKVRRATLVLKARRESEALQVLTAQQVHKDPLDQKVILVIPDRLAQREKRANRGRRAFRAKPAHRGQRAIPDRLVRAPMLQLRLADTRTRKPIFTLTLPPFKGLRRRLRRFKEVNA